MPDFQPQPVKVFIVYARENKDFKERIEKTLLPAVRRGEIDLFTDAQIEYGEDWHERLSQELARAEIAVFLLSIDYYASEYIHRDEAVIARSRHERGELLILPVVVEECSWKRDPFLSKIQLLPADGRPIGDLKNSAAFAEVAEAIESKALEIQQKEVEKHQKERKKAETEARKLEADAEKTKPEPTFLKPEKPKVEPKKSIEKAAAAPKKPEIQNPKSEIEPPILEEKKGFDWQVAGIVAGVLVVAALGFWLMKKGIDEVFEKIKPTQPGIVFQQNPDTSALKNSTIPISKLPAGSMVGTTKKVDEKPQNQPLKSQELKPINRKSEMNAAERDRILENFGHDFYHIQAGNVELNGQNYSYPDISVSKHEVSEQIFEAVTGRRVTRQTITTEDVFHFLRKTEEGMGQKVSKPTPIDLACFEKMLGRKLPSDGLGFRVSMPE